MAANQSVIANGFVGIRQDRLAVIDASQDDQSLPQARRTIDAAAGLVMPGLVNAHTHLPMVLFRGLADDMPLQQWLQAHIFPAERRYIDAAAVYQASLLACAELLLGGTTTCCDGYFYETEVARAADAMGLRGIFGQGVVDFAAPGVPEATRNIEHALAFVTFCGAMPDRVHPSIFAHAPYTCSAATLAAAKRAARQNGLLFQIHVAETRAEYDASLATHGLTPVAYLAQLDLLDTSTLLVHGVWLSEADIGIIAQHGCAAVHCPDSNLKLASGIAPVPQLQAAGVTVALGTDGAASNNRLDLFAAMNLAAKLHKVREMDPTALDALSVLRMATIEGARALGLDHQIGSLEVGKKADLIVLDTAQPHLSPMYKAESHLIYAARSADVRHVVVDGQLLIQDRRLLNRDINALMADVETLAATIRAACAR